MHTVGYMQSKALPVRQPYLFDATVRMYERVSKPTDFIFLFVTQGSFSKEGARRMFFSPFQY